MSLGGLAISIGMIIDATIIQVENVQRHLSRSRAGGRASSRPSSRPCSRSASRRIFGELIIALTFIPIIALQGIEGKMFLPLAFTHVIALFASLAPVALGHPGLLPSSSSSRSRRSGSSSSRRPGRPICRSCAGACGHKAVLVVVSVGAPGRGAAPRPAAGDGVHAHHGRGRLRHGLPVPAGHLPRRVPGDEPQGRGAADGVPRARDDRRQDRPDRHRPGGPGRREDRLRRHAQAARRMDDGPDPRGADRQDARGDGRTSRAWPSPSASPSPAASTSSSPGPGPSSSSSSSARTWTSSRTKADEIAAVLGRIRGADGPRRRERRRPALRHRSGPTGPGSPAYGLNVEDVQAVVETAVGGKTVTQIYEGEKFFDLQLRYPEEQRELARGHRRPSSSGRRAGPGSPSSQVAEIAHGGGPGQISRESGQRRIGVECNISGRDLGGFVAEARRAIGRERHASRRAIILTWGGQFENQQRAMRRLAVILPADDRPDPASCSS